MAVPFGRRLLIRQFATALSVSVTVPAANELLPLFIDAVNSANVAPVRMREAAAADTARPVTASSPGRLTGCAPTWRMRDTSLPSGPAVRAGREGAGTRFPPRPLDQLQRNVAVGRHCCPARQAPGSGLLPACTAWKVSVTVALPPW